MTTTAHPRSLRLALLRKERPDIAQVADWLEAEREYAEGKWTPETVDNSITPERYKEWVEQYMSRAIVLGLDNPLGRQALAKALRTLQGWVESTVRTQGPLPPGGLPSGEIV